MAVTSSATAPALAFSVLDAARVEHAAAPTLGFSVRVDAPGGEAIRSVLLDVQLQIAARRRRYDAAAEERLLELFGPVKDWGATLRNLLWTRATLVVPQFSGTVFYAGSDGRLQAARISWEQDAQHRLPVRVWRETMDHHFPGTAWLR